ncbi:hypothetical protein N9R79_04725 [Vibrio sp.]|nr:hypothetical protein [Vibrio sp.]
MKKQQLFMTGILSGLLSYGLLGCSQSSLWESSDSAEISGTHIQLESQLWLNNLPNVDRYAKKKQTLHGSLRLTRASLSPEKFKVDKLLLRQDKEALEINSRLVEIKALDEHQWEVVFRDETQRLSKGKTDIAILLSSGDGDEAWLVEDKVIIQEVF